MTPWFPPLVPRPPPPGLGPNFERPEEKQVAESIPASGAHRVGRSSVAPHQSITAGSLSGRRYGASSRVTWRTILSPARNTQSFPLRCVVRIPPAGSRHARRVPALDAGGRCGGHPILQQHHQWPVDPRRLHLPIDPAPTGANRRRLDKFEPRSRKQLRVCAMSGSAHSTRNGRRARKRALRMPTRHS